MFSIGISGLLSLISIHYFSNLNEHYLKKLENKREPKKKLYRGPKSNSVTVIKEPKKKVVI